MMHKNHKKWLFVFGLLYLVFLILGASAFVMIKPDKPETPVETKAEEPKPKVKPELTPAKMILPANHLLTVPYTVQAPLVNWNIHEETCEEAAVLMAHYYLKGDKTDIISPVLANQELVTMKNWQVKNWGSEIDLTLPRVGEFAKQYYGYKYRVKEDITADDIKNELIQGHPVLVPVITHALENPHYGRNPSYHILVIKGYDINGVITNDAGVKEGRNYHYTWPVLWQAIDAQSSQMKQGRDLLVITK